MIVVLRWMLKPFTRGQVIRAIFDDDELVAIKNALWRRSKDDTDKDIPYNEVIKYTCEKIVKEI